MQHMRLVFTLILRWRFDRAIGRFTLQPRTMSLGNPPQPLQSTHHIAGDAKSPPLYETR